MRFTSSPSRWGQQRALARLSSLLPPLSPWESAALWHGILPIAVPSLPLDPASLNRIIDQRLAPLMLSYLREHGAEPGAEVVRELRASAFDWTRRTHAVLSAGAGIVGMLAAEGLPTVVSKGPGLAALYPASHSRPFSDLDLLADPRHFAGIVEALQSRGWTEADRNVQPWRYFDRHCREGLNLERGAGESVDVHHHVPPWVFSRGLSMPDLIARSEPVSAPGGTTLPCLSPEDNLLLVALHAISDKNKPGKTLIIWRDLAVLAGVVDPAELVARAVGSGLASWVRAVLSALPDGIAGVAELIAALPADGLPSSWRLTALLDPRLQDTSVLVTQLLRLPLANGAAFALGMAFPSRAFIERSYPNEPRGYLKWWRRAS